MSTLEWYFPLASRRLIKDFSFLFVYQVLDGLKTMAGKKARGYRAKTRAKITGSKNRPTVTQLLRTYTEGDKVQIVINGTIHKGMPFRRFHGLTGTVLGMQGRAVRVAVKQGSQDCELVVSPIHLKEIHNMSATEAA